MTGDEIQERAWGAARAVITARLLTSADPSLAYTATLFRSLDDEMPVLDAVPFLQALAGALATIAEGLIVRYARPLDLEPLELWRRVLADLDACTTRGERP